jgi:hypothetical protein
MGSAARTVVLWTAAALGAGGLAFAAGVSGLLGNPVAKTDAASPVVAPLEGTPMLDCPAGEPVGVAARDERLYVIGRSPDLRWLAVRSVEQGYRTVWVPFDSIRSDQYPVGLDALPEQQCEAP